MMRRDWILSAWINNFPVSYSLNNQPSYQYHIDPVLHKWSVHLWRSNHAVPPLVHQLAATLSKRITSEVLMSPAISSVFCITWSLKATYLWAMSVGIYLLKGNNRNTRTRREICSKLTIKTPERRQWRRSGVFIVNFKHVSHIVLVFLLLTLNM